MPTGDGGYKYIENKNVNIIYVLEAKEYLD